MKDDDFQGHAQEEDIYHRGHRVHREKEERILPWTSRRSELFPLTCISLTNAFPKQKTQFVAFCRTINQDNAGGWRVRAWVKTCCGSLP